MCHLRALDLSSREALDHQDPAALGELTALFLDAIAERTLIQRSKIRIVPAWAELRKRGPWDFE
jgi:hypothetical protein